MKTQGNLQERNNIEKTKTRVALLTATSFPQLELVPAVLGLRVTESVLRILKVRLN